MNNDFMKNKTLTRLRSKSEKEIQEIFDNEYFKDQNNAIKMMFYVGDIRGGLGERDAFRIMFKRLATNHCQSIASDLIPLIPHYNRWDSVTNIICDETYPEQVRKSAVDLIKKQIEIDKKRMEDSESISLLGKWLPSSNTSSKETKEKAFKIYTELGMQCSEYRKMLSSFRKYLEVLEVKMSAGSWDEIDPARIPSVASYKYRDAFSRQNLNNDIRKLGTTEPSTDNYNLIDDVLKEQQ